MSHSNSQLFALGRASFEAARRIEILPPGHPAAGLHGHSFQLTLQQHGTWEAERLAQHLATAVAPLNYSELNQHLAIPSDGALLRHLSSTLPPPAAAQLRLRSAPDQGVEQWADGSRHAWHRYRFEAAHRLPNVPPDHPCGRMHGHSFGVTLYLRLSNDDPHALAAAALDRHWSTLHARLHHTCLNQLAGLTNPTSELLSHWLWQQLRPQLPALSRVSVRETATAGCDYDGEHFRIWKERTFESALALPQQGLGLHGHSYRIRLHLTSPLDELLGWTVDYGDVKRLFQPLYQQIDHHRLDQLPQLPQADTPHLADWLRQRLAPALPQLHRIELWETSCYGVLLEW